MFFSEKWNLTEGEGKKAFEWLGSWSKFGESQPRQIIISLASVRVQPILLSSYLIIF